MGSAGRNELTLISILLVILFTDGGQIRARALGRVFSRPRFCSGFLSGSGRRTPAVATEIYADSEAFCDQLVSRSGKRSRLPVHALTCATAVQRHRLRAQRVTGTQHQQELILQATYLYFTAAG